MVGADDKYSGNIEVWSTDYEDEKVCKSTHRAYFAVNMIKDAKGGKCFIFKSSSSWSREYFYDEGGSLYVCLSTKSIKQHVAASEKVINKVYSILKSLDIPVSHYDFELTDLWNTICKFCESLKWDRIRVSNLDDDFSRSTFRCEERRIKVEELYVDYSRVRDDVIVLKNDNRLVMTHMSIFLSNR